jgi:RNA polymerase sigma-70 factor (ECF subfamily)
MELTSLSLLDRLQTNQSQQDWFRFVEVYEPFIRRFIRIDPRLAADVDDVCQEVMRKIISYLPRFERGRNGSFRTWLKTVTVNEVNSYWRRKFRDANRNSPMDALRIESLADPSNGLSKEWDREHGRHVLRRLQELVKSEFAPTTWRAFELRVIEERSSAEVAAVMGISRNAVDIAKSRVLARLRREAAGLLE